MQSYTIIPLDDHRLLFRKFRVSIPRLANSQTIRQCQDKILQDELDFKRHCLRHFAKHVAPLEQQLKENVPHMIYVGLMIISGEIVNKRMTKIQDKHSSKLNRLRAIDSFYIPERRTGLNPVKNLSSYTLSEDEHDARINGLHHVYAPEKFNQPQFICDMEYFYSRLLNIRTPYRHYESKPANLNVRHQFTPAELNTASHLRHVANIFQNECTP
ncbi:unnamed protein product [Adineta ricciae]|uniref:Uncharacterized protein n=1 Tax=Adineta ricciae TaxID=249248 RepID=A0A815V286_ADIRI|nr:unnamed protein product [Adineta ricciae]CAF1550977.1 unnamed protein product [Adineta ricciae]